jgi:hypothetical protein
MVFLSKVQQVRLMIQLDVPRLLFMIQTLESAGNVDTRKVRGLRDSGVANTLK